VAENVRIGIVASASRRQPCSSSTFTRPSQARSEVKRLAFAVVLDVGMESRWSR
jgi:hypothetical protein